jgi:hypothetical protein
VVCKNLWMILCGMMFSVFIPFRILFCSATFLKVIDLLRLHLV